MGPGYRVKVRGHCFHGTWMGSQGGESASDDSTVAGLILKPSGGLNLIVPWCFLSFSFGLGD